MNNFNITIKRQGTRGFVRLQKIALMLLIGLSIILTGTIQATRQANAQFDDWTPLTANPTKFPSANVAGWTNNDVTVKWNWSDNTLGRSIDSNNCTIGSTSSGEGTIHLTATCSDLTGNVGNANYTVKVDKIAPMANSTLSSPATTVGITAM